MSGDMTDIIDALRAVLEPTPSGITLDDTLAEPASYAPSTLYAWPHRESFVEQGTDLDRHDFTVRVGYGAPRGDEVDADVRYRTVSQAIQAKVSTYRTAVRTHRTRSDELWSDLHVDAVDYAPLRGFDARGFLMDITGWSFAE